MKKIILILSVVLVLLIIITIVISGRAFKRNENTQIPSITPAPVFRVDNNFREQPVSTLSDLKRKELKDFTESLPISTENLEVAYSNDLNRIVAHLKTPEALDEFRDLLIDSNLIDLYDEGSEIFIISDSDVEATVEEIKEELAEVGNEDGHDEATPGQSVDNKDIELLTDLLNVLLSLDEFATETETAPPVATPRPTEPPTRTGALRYPPNLGSPNSLGYYQMPTSGDYIFSGVTCSAQRYGKREMIGVLYTVALEWKKKYSGSRLRINDLNASGHKSHKNGIDVDITEAVGGGKGPAAWMDHPSYSSVGRAKSIELAKLFVSTGLIKSILFNDPSVNQAVMAYARKNNLRLQHMSTYPGHRDHFHIRLNTPKGPYHSPSC